MGLGSCIIHSSNTRTKETGKKISQMDLEYKHGKKYRSIKDNSKMELKTERAYIADSETTFIKELLRIINFQDLVLLILLMDKIIMEIF
jgi:hypothetical protein